MAKEDKSLNERLSGLSPGQLKDLLRKGRDGSAPRPGKPPKMERNEAGIFPLSKAQERMWFLNKLTEGEALYNNPVALRISAEFRLNIDILVQSLGILTERHEILRTSFNAEEGVPVQQIHPSGKPEIIYEDLRHLPSDERETKAISEAVEHGKTLIPLDALPLLRFKVLHLQDSEYMLLINPHHIISDGWSNALFAKELSMTYAALENRETPPFPVPEYQYIDFVKWEKDWMSTPAYAGQLQFWKTRLEDLPEPLRLPLDFQRPAIMSYRGSKEFSSVNVEETDILRQFCQRENITLFHLLFGAFGLLMSKYSGQNDIMVGVPVARRNQLAFQQTMGLFINTLPMRVKTGDHTTAIDFLKEVRESCQQAFMRQELPFEKLIEELNPHRSLSTNPVFQVHFVYQNIPSLYSVKGLSVKPESIDYSYSKFDLNFWVEEANHGLILSVTYPEDIFLPRTIQKLLVNYKTLLSSFISSPEEECGRLVYFSGAERSVCFGKATAYPEPGPQKAPTWLDEFKARVRSEPGRIAVRDLAQRISYGELDSDSDHLANILAGHGVVKGDLIGLFLPRNASLVISILGIFKAGAAYVPLDKNLPPGRLKFIAEDASLRLIIGSEELPGAIAGTGVPVLLYNEMMAGKQENGHKNEAEAIAKTPGPEFYDQGDLAYVIYTSGTTGIPKGVCIGSDQLLNYSKAVWKRMNLDAGDSFAIISSIAADLGNTMIFPPLIHQGEVVIVPEDLTTDASLLAQWFESSPVDCLKIVPSHIQSLLHSSRAGSLLPKKLLMLGGEKCDAGIIGQVRNLAPELRIINHYGPTEATIGSLTWEIPFKPAHNALSFPIGFPLDNTAVYISGRDMQLVPKGIPGEIILSGKNIARGYLNRPQLTLEKFADDPFSAGHRIYHTGDLGKMNEDGSVVFLGRMDHQIKIRGFRVETIEIEVLLNTYPAIEQAAVLVPENVSSLDSVEAAISLKKGFDFHEYELRQWLSSHLPSYMIPSAFHVTDHFPITSNGKTDLRELYRMTKKSMIDAVSSLPPRDLTELKLLNIFRDILKAEVSGIDDGFFDLGGHSLLAIQLFAEIEKEFHVHLPLSTLFERESVAKLAELLRASGGKQKRSALVTIRPGTGKKQLFMVHPAGGNVLCYYELGRELGINFSVYGLQSAGLYGKTVETVSDLAGLYLEEICLPDSIDDVVFGGWSMGALIAFEMARQVREKTGKSPRLLIIDQLAPLEDRGGAPNTGIDPVERIMVFAAKVAHLAGRPLGISVTDLQGKTPEQQSEVFLKAFKVVNLVPPDLGLNDFHGYLDQMILHNEITAACRPGFFEGKTLLVRAEEALPLFEGEDGVPERSADLGWGSWVRDNLTIRDIPGNHVSVISQPYVREIALALRKWMDP